VTASPTTSDDQDAVIQFLSDPASYGAYGEVERIDTHCSIVFLTEDHAYKLKRAIRYASLDYTTRELRQTACETEIVLNRRTAPELYVGVRSINRGPSDALKFGGEGPELDHVVVMRRFAQSDLFDRMAQTGTLTSELMHALGEAVARLHLIADNTTPQHGGAEAIRRVIADNDRELAKVAAELDGAAVGALSSRARTALDGLAALLDRRRNAGRVRRCHGDLRLANICLYAGQPTLFDCIEFSDEIGCIDVLYDLAFLLMDLQMHGRGDFGNAVFNAYLDLAPETEGLRALPLFLALRAATRSYALAGSAGRRTDPQEAARLLAFARRHIDAGIEFLAPQHPAPGARILRLDPSREGIWGLASATLAAGCSILVEGVLTKAADQTEAVELASCLGVSLLRFWAGKLPPHLDGRLWRTLDADPDALAAFAKAGTLEGVVSVRAGPRSMRHRVANASMRWIAGTPAMRLTEFRTLSVTLPPHDGEGLLGLPAGPARGIVLFAHGSGSSRLSPRNAFVAEALQHVGIATLLFDLLTDQEAAARANVFDIPLLADRLDQAATWVLLLLGVTYLWGSSVRAPAPRRRSSRLPNARMCGPSSAVVDALISPEMRWRKSTHRHC
jgi:uncharacterized protein